MHLETLDIVVVAVYALSLLLLAQWVSREKAGHQKNTGDYFLAGRALPWWAIGASLIAANISAEQIIGMSGSAFVMGIAIGVYEWTAAVTLIVVGKYLLPVFLKHKIYTMPQFLEQRFDARVKTVLGLFWLGVYVFVNLTSILWLGSLAINTVTGIDISLALVLLASFASAYSLYGGLKAVAMTDIVQVVLLVMGGLMIAYISMNEISGGRGVIEGFRMTVEQVPEKFDLILSPDNPNYVSLPGISVILGGMWVMHFSYWGFNQYIIQRALAAKDAREAQKGILFAAFLKMFMPILVVMPGIAAVILTPDLSAPDQAYPEIMKLLPVGITGLVFAALIAAIVSSLASMMNSISTIFTLDIYKPFSRTDKSDVQLVTVGRIVSLSAIIIAGVVARPLLGNFDQAFQYIQEFTGFFTPGVVVIFLLAIFWKKTTANGAIAAAIGSAIFSIAFKLLLPTLPFIDRVGIVFLLCLAVGMLVSSIGGARDQPGAIDYGDIDTSTTTGFNLGTLAVLLILVALYATWW
jgi:SSS family solute:Na+ symporter